MLNSDVKICIITFEILIRCDFLYEMIRNFMLSTSSTIKFFFEKMCKNARINLKNIVVRIFIFVIKNDNHDFIFETSYKRKVMLSFKYFVDKLNEIIIYSQCDIKKSNFKRSHLIINRTKR